MDQQRRAPSQVKVFNATTKAFLASLRKVFRDDAVLAHLSEQFAGMAADRGTEAVPALKFCMAMSQPTGLVAAPERGAPPDAPLGEACVGDLILSGDERLFSPRCTADIPILGLISFRDKWAVLDAGNRAVVWQYLQRLAKSAARAAIDRRVADGSAAEMIEAVRAADIPSGGTVDERVRAAMDDSRVRALAERISADMAAEARTPKE